MLDMSDTILKCTAEGSSTFCLAVVNVEEMSGRENYIEYPTESFLLFAGHQVAECLAGNQNVRQGTDCLPDVLIGHHSKRSGHCLAWIFSHFCYKCVIKLAAKL